MPEQYCPICNSRALYQGIDFGKKMLYDCPICKIFVINPETELLVKNAPQKYRDDISSESINLSNDSVLYIWATEAVKAENGSLYREIKWSKRSRNEWG